MRFWGLGIPDYASDYESSNLNGEIETDVRLPSVDCEVCMMTWGYAGLRSVPFECPEMLRGEMSSNGDRQSVFREEHFDLQRRLFEEAGVQGRPFTDIRPGYRFPPLYFDVPSRPRADFLWPFGGLLVSTRIRNLLMELCQDDLATSPVILRRVGRRDAKPPAPIPRTGEPEDIIKGSPLLAGHSGVGPYYEVIPRHQSKEHRIIELQCDACGWVKTKVVQTEKWNWRMNEDHWQGHSIFYWGGTLHVVITENVKDALQAARPSNVEFIQM
jgi:hypothetical protein